MARPEYTYLNGNYTLISGLNSGVVESPGVEADWNAISTFKSSLQERIQQGANINQILVQGGATPQATFGVLGGVYTSDSGSNTLDPRIWAVNSGRRWRSFGAEDGSDTPSSAGNITCTMTLLGTANASGTDNDGTARLTKTAAGAGNDCGLAQSAINNGTMQTRFRLYNYMKLKLGQLTGFRFSYNASDSVNSYNSALPACNIVGVRFDPGAGDTTFQLISGNGSSSVTDTKVTVVANTLYEIEWWTDNGTTLSCRINNGRVITKTSLMPTSTTNLNTTYGAYIRSTAAGVVTGTFYNGFFSQG